MNKVEQNIIERTNSWKKSLLDMTKRNRLLWYKPYRVGSLKFEKGIFDNDVEDVLDLINNLAFNNEIIEFIVDRKICDTGNVNNDETEKDEMIKKRTKILSNLNKKIKSENEEKGLNIGYIAVGFLRWYERDDTSVEIKSPLIMVPIKIEQDGRHESFKISLNSEEEITINPVIKKKLESDFSIKLMIDVHNSEGEITIKKLLEFVKMQINISNNWEIVDEAVIDTFSFQNLAIWNDLDKNKELIINNPFSKVLAGAERKDENFFMKKGLLI